MGYHNHLRPSNILLKSSDDMHVMLDDFYSFFKYGNMMMHDPRMRRIEFIRYQVPELLQGEEYSDKADMWSIGLITYELICGFCPFLSDETNLSSLYDEIL